MKCSHSTIPLVQIYALQIIHTKLQAMQNTATCVLSVALMHTNDSSPKNACGGQEDPYLDV